MGAVGCPEGARGGSPPWWALGLWLGAADGGAWGEGLRGVWYPLPRWFWDAYIRCLPPQHKVITSFLGFRESEKQR